MARLATHDMPCQQCGHATHSYLPCSDSCDCVPAWLPGIPASEPVSAMVRGRVVHGDRRGRRLGFPTANLDARTVLEEIPDGVYAGWLTRRDTGQRWPAAISVGTNPTFGGVRTRRVEGHVIDHSDLELYGVEIEIELTELVREMRAFASVAALVEQMQDDVRRVRSVLCSTAGIGA